MYCVCMLAVIIARYLSIKQLLYDFFSIYFGGYGLTLWQMTSMYVDVYSHIYVNSK
jgi:hypothetical protein